MKGRKIISVLFSLCMLFCLVLAPAKVADASNEAVQNARKGILEVRNYVYEDGSLIFGSRGTGFLVGTDNGAQTVITNYHVVEIPTDEKALKNYLTAYGVQYSSNASLETVIEIVVKRDVVITAEIVNYSEAGDFAILKLEQPIYDRSPLQLADSSAVVATQPVYALGFPSAIEANAQSDEIYTAEDVTVTDGTVSKIADSNATGAPISTIVHSATISGGNSGGPLVTADGHVVGINTYLVSDTTASYYYSTEINEVKDILDALGIEYLAAGETAAVEDDTEEVEDEIEEIEDNTDALAQLEAVIEEAEDIDVTKCTEESVEAFEEALDAANDISSDATIAEIDGAKADLEDAMDGLVEKSGPSIGLIIGIAAAVIIVIIVIVVVATKGKKNKAAAQQAQARPVPPVQSKPLVPPIPAAPQTGRPSVPPMPVMSEGSEETGVLNDGSSETTVLGGGQSVPLATLLRRKNNERITISKQVFKLGKERRKVDYCVSDNTNISRTHADIVYKNGEFYIVDNKATNGTFVNGVSVAAGQERKLMNNDMIKLADEEFQFRTF